jgi:hypothetical protein
MKIKCTICGNLKESNKELFSFIYKDGKTGYCRECAKKQSRKYYYENQDKLLKQKRENYKNNPELILERNRVNYYKHREEYLLQKKDYWVENKDKITDYRSQNRDRDRLQRRERTRIRKVTEPFFRFKKNVRELVRNYFEKEGLKKNTNTKKIIGCDFLTLYNHLKLTFESSYKIDYRDEFYEFLNIDHIIPISIAKTKEKIFELNHYTNLQFLYYKDNIQKSNKLNWILDLTKTELYGKINYYPINYPILKT